MDRPRLAHPLAILLGLGGSSPALAQCLVTSFDTREVGGPTFLTDVDADGEWAVLGGVGGPALLLERTLDGWQPAGSLPGCSSLLDSLAVAIEGSRAVAGAGEEDGGAGWLSGMVCVYERDASGWRQVQAIVPSDAGPEQAFGAAVALDGETLVVGAPHALAHFGDGDAALYVFELRAGVWVEVQTVQAVSWSTGFGRTLALDGDVLVAGDVGASPGGAAVVFERVAGVFVETARLTSPGLLPYSRFGAWLDVDAGRIVAGTSGTTAPPTIGAVHVFERPGGVWTETHTLRPSDAVLGASFGGVALDGARILAAGHTGIYAFDESGGTWTERWKLESPGDELGVAVALGTQAGFAVAEWERVHVVDLGIEATGTLCSDARARLEAGGCESVQADALALEASPVASGEAGLLLLGTARTRRPFGDGVLCIDAPLRGPLAVADAAGRLRFELDLDSLAGGALQAGSTWLFQALFRAPSTGGAGFDLSEARWVTLVP